MSDVVKDLEPKEEKKPVTVQDINEARHALAIATTMLLSDSGKPNQAGAFAYYANFLSRMRITINDRVPTAGVSVTDRVNLYINPHFFNKLGVPGCIEQQELLIHEIEHIVHEHCTRAKELSEGEKGKMNSHKLSNIAQDSQINRTLPHISKDFGVTIERLNKQMQEYGSSVVISEEDNSETIYWKLKQFQKEENENLPSMGQGEGGELDDHSVWEESEKNEELAKAVIKDAANKAAEQTGIGNIPAHILKQLGELNKSQVDWKRQLQQFAVRTMKYAKINSRAKRNRRTGILFSGKKKEPKVKVVVIGDESGSMSDDAVKQIFSEIDKIHSFGVEIVYIAMDAVVHDVVQYKKGMVMKRSACGGTYYTPGIEKAKSLSPDAIILIGDGDSSDKPKNPGIPFLWVIVGSQKAPGDFGKTIHIMDK